MKNLRQVFISYGREADFGTPIAQELYDRIADLEKPTLKPFLDTTDLDDADKWRPQLKRHIEDSFLIIVLCSQKANGSQYVTFEWSYAMGKEKRILPIEIQPPTSSEYEDANPISPILLDYNSSVLSFTNPTEVQWRNLLDSIIDIYYREYTPTPIQRAMEFAEHPLDDYRRQALRSLYENEHHKSVDALVTLVNDTYIPQVRWEAAQYLAMKPVPRNEKLNRPEALLQHQGKKEIAIPELASKLWGDRVGRNVANGGKSGIFNIALAALKKIDTNRAYEKLADFYIQTDIRDKKHSIVANFNIEGIPLPECESHMVRMLKYRDNDSAPDNKWVLIKWLAEAGNLDILTDITEFIHGERQDIRVRGNELQTLLEEYMQGYKNIEDVLPIYMDVLNTYIEKNVRDWELLAKSCLTALGNRGGRIVEVALEDLLQKLINMSAQRSGFISEIKFTLKHIRS